MLHQFANPINNIFGQSPQIMWQTQQYEYAQNHHHNYYYQQQIQHQLQHHQLLQLPLLLPQVSCSKTNLRKDSEIDSVLSGYSTESEFIPEKQSASNPTKGKRKQLQLVAKAVNCFEGNYQNSMSQGGQKMTEQSISMNPQKQQGYSLQQQGTQKLQAIYVQKQSILQRNQPQSPETQQTTPIQSQPQYQQQTQSNKTSTANTATTSSITSQLVSSTPQQTSSSSPSSSPAGSSTGSTPSILLNNPTTGAFEKFKTEMCKNWVEKGKCAYGQKCQFAHGKHELVDKRQAGGKLYKSKLCNTFHSTGMCPYGSRCMFIHEDRTTQEIKESFYFQNKLKSEDNILETRTVGNRLQFFENLTKNEPKSAGELGPGQEENSQSTL